MSDANRPVPTQAENDALITHEMHPDEISDPTGTTEREKAKREEEEAERQRERAKRDEERQRQQPQSPPQPQPQPQPPPRRPGAPATEAEGAKPA